MRGSGLMGGAQHGAPGWALVVGVTPFFWKEGERRQTWERRVVCVQEKKTLVFPWIEVGD